MSSSKLTLAAVLALSFSGSALAAKPASDCSLAPLRLQVGALNTIIKGYAKYCDKSPDAEASLKISQKTIKKVNKICEQYNERLAKLDCATDGDPDVGAPSPVNLPCLTKLDLAEALDESCDGIDTQ